MTWNNCPLCDEELIATLFDDRDARLLIPFYEPEFSIKCSKNHYEIYSYHGKIWEESFDFGEYRIVRSKDYTNIFRSYICVINQKRFELLHSINHVMNVKDFASEHRIRNILLLA